MTAPDDESLDNAPQTTTRVCIKNVPLSFTEDKLRQHLISSSSFPLTITDCRILKTPNGKSRKLAFCGFISSEMARAVIQEFHGTYANTSKLTVEPAYSKKDATVRPWSQHSVGSSRYQAKHHDEQPTEEAKETELKKQGTESNEVKRKKQEFLAAMGAVSTRTKFWANDDGGEVVEEKEAEAVVQDERKQASESSEDSSSDDSVVSDADSIDSGGAGANALKASSAPHGSVVSDMDFLRSKVTAAEELSDDDDSDSSSDEEKNENETTAAIVEETVAQPIMSDSSDSDSSDDSDSDKEHVADQSEGNSEKRTSESQDDDPNRLFVRNLPFTTTEEELQEHMASFGTVASCHIPIDDQKRNKGFAFVTFQKSDDATRARTELDGSDFQGRLLHVLPARKGNATAGDSVGDESGLTYKQKQELARQKDALATAKGWSASFVRGDAVVDNLADRLGLHKGEILNVKDGLSSGDAAVRLALGETHIIEENREYFRKEGVDMDALVSVKGDTSGKRSTTAILVKNLPYDTELEELTRMFHGVGDDAPQRILLPPSRTIALVEYGHATDARRAFRKLAYKRFKHVPLYLEWAPLAAKVESKPDNDTKEAATSSQTVDDDKAEEEETVEPGVSHTIYVKNLNFATTEQELMRVFQNHVKSIRAVKIPTKTAPIKKVRGGGVIDSDVKSLSMGFGFVECDSEESVRKAVRALQGTIVDGHALELKRSSKALTSNPKQHAAVPVKQGANPTKLMVRNVPFQATRKELLQLFGSFGHLKKVRLPKKFDGTHRGFAFVEFLTGQEAQTAMNTLSSTHLYGRHLVLEWASDKDDMDTLREKAKRDVDQQPAPKNKKIRFQ